MKFSVRGTIDVSRSKRLRCRKKEKCDIEEKKTKEEKNDNCKNYEFLLAQYNVLSDRRIQHNQLLWDKPSILFTAQAVLWVVTLNPDTNSVIRVFLAVLSVLISCTMTYSFHRCRNMEICDAEQLYWIEKHFVDEGIPALIIHHKKDIRTVLYKGKNTLLMSIPEVNSNLRLENPKAKSTFVVLRWTFILTIIVSSIVFIYSLYEIGLISSILKILYRLYI